MTLHFMGIKSHKYDNINSKIFMATFKRNFEFEDNIMIKVSNNIKKYRKIADITQEQLAVDVGKSYDFIRRLEYKNELLVVLLTLYIKFWLF